MSVKHTPTAPTQEKSVIKVNVNVRLVGRYMTESASQVGFTNRRPGYITIKPHGWRFMTKINDQVSNYRVPTCMTTINARMAGRYMTDSESQAGFIN